MMKRVVCYGDSNTYGFDPTSCPPGAGGAARFDEHTRWPMVLADMLGNNYDVVENGLNGRTTVFEDPLAPCRNGQASLQSAMLMNDPVDAFVIMLGTNDCKDMFGVSAQVIAWGLERLVVELKGYIASSLNPAARILIVSPIHVTKGSHDAFVYDFSERSVEKLEQMAEYYQAICQKRGVDFLDAALYAEPGKTDGLHLEADGHRKLAAAVCGKLHEMIG